MSESEGPAFVDTNVLVYALENHASIQKPVAKTLISQLADQQRLRVSTQILQELFATLTRKVRQPCSSDQALEFLDQLAAGPLFIVDYLAIRQAALLARDAQLSFCDALIVVAAARSGATRLYTEDLNHGQKLLGVEVVNPFRKSVVK
jgi:predicted nucleic acid-binding protein